MIPHRLLGYNLFVVAEFISYRLLTHLYEVNNPHFDSTLKVGMPVSPIPKRGMQ
jgi:hypothetical protein